MKSNQKGQGILEYIIITGLVGIFCLSAMKQFGSSMKNKITQMKETLNQNISIGN